MQIIECSHAVCTQWIQCEICILTLFSRTCFSKTTCCNNAVWPTFACTQHCLDTMSMLLGTQLGLVHFHFLIPFHFPSSAPDVGCKKACDWRGLQQTGQVWWRFHHHWWCSRSLRCQGAFHDISDLVLFDLLQVNGWFMTIWIGKVLPVLAPVYERQSVDKITLDEPILQCFSQVFSITSRLQCGTKYKQINFGY